MQTPLSITADVLLTLARRSTNTAALKPYRPLSVQYILAIRINTLSRPRETVPQRLAQAIAAWLTP